MKTIMRARRSGLFKKIAAIVAILSLHSSMTARAQTNQPEGLTLPVAVEIAFRTNPLIRATKSGQEMADSKIDEARAGRLPIVQFNETFARGNNPVFVFSSLLEQGRFTSQNFALDALNDPASLNNFRSSISIRAPLFDQRQTRTRINQAQIERQQSDAEAERARQQIRFEVLRAYYGLLVARAKKEVADEAARMAQADVKRIRDMHEAGMVVASDLLSAEVQLAEFQQQQIQAEGERVTAQAALNAALGLSIDTPQTVTGQLVEKEFEAASQEEFIQFAMRNRPEMIHARLSVESAREQTRGARGQFLPRVEIFGNFGASGQGLASGSSDYTIGASVTFNLFDPSRRARIDQSRVAQELAAAGQDALANQIRLEVVRAYQLYISARARLAVAARAVEQSRETLRIIQDRYREGLTTITESLRAQTTFVRARLNLLASRYDHYTGFAAVLLASGRLTDIQPFV
ncbi:MAG: TolC family protein [Acidobacteriota bacterium]